MLSRGTLLRVVLGVGLLATGSPAGDAAAPPTAVARLRPDVAAFWNGGVRPVVATSDGNQLREFPIDVPAGGRRLRVSYDHPDYRVGFDFVILDPQGKETRAHGYNSAEIAVVNPQAGRWLVRVDTAEDSAQFKLRALLEKKAPAGPRGATPVLPNLRLVPPYEFTFAASLGSIGGLGVPSGLGAPGRGCTPDDIAEYQAMRCLRFSLGPANLGPGPFEMLFESGQGLATPGTARQRIHHADGTTSERTAGQFEYHKTHAHYHHTGFGTLELLRVTDPARGTMTPAGQGPKQGFCTADIMIADWWSFRNADQNATPSQCLAEGGSSGHNNPTGTAMAISAGWADLYSWEQDGNYVDFGSNGDGRYVVRSTTDAAGHVLETNERDNTSYAYIEVRGTTIKVLERGVGTSPWDRAKALARDGLNALASVQV